MLCRYRFAASAVLTVWHVMSVATMEQVVVRDEVIERNETQEPKPLVFNHKYSINIPAERFCQCPGTPVDPPLGPDLTNEFMTNYNDKPQNASKDFVHVHRGYVTPSRYDVDEQGRPYADSFHFNHRIQIPGQKCACSETDLQMMKLNNQKLRADLEMLEKTFVKRLRAVEKKLKNQSKKKCKVCKKQPVLDVIQGTEEEPVIRGLGRRHCLSNCSGNGECVDGLCKCRPGFTGKDCKTSKCPNACSGHGSCKNQGKCKCWGKWAGKDCSEKACPKNCGGNGVCRDGSCGCNKGFTGKDCSIKKCKNSCSNHGKCVEGRCDCQVNWEGKDCSIKRCPRNCSSNGVCENGRCLCEEQWSGKSCNLKRCSNDCNSNGRCRNGTCQCSDQWTGEDCSMLKCPSDCSGFGTCHNGTCSCNEGWAGHDCTVLHCPDMCSSNGRCVDHVCVCDDGWEGINCASVPSPSNLQVSNIRPTTIDITWSQSRAKITRNQVNCIPMSGTANAVYQSVGPNVTKVTIRDLDSGTQYSVFVFAMVEDALSAPVTASVKTAVDAPSTLSWLKVGPTFVEISWSPPKAKIDRYKIVCSCKQGGAEFGVLPNKTSVLIKDLLPGDTYTVSLYAVQGKDVSEPININFTTSLDSPTDLEFVNVTATSALAQWNKSKARIDGYEISFLQLGSQDPEIIGKKVPSTSNQLILNGLKPDTQYNVTLNSYRDGMKSLPFQAILIAGIESPHRAHVTNLLPDAVTLQWEAPNEKIKQFRITMRTKQAFEEGASLLADIVLPESIKQASFDDLIPGTEYVAQIYSVQRERESGALLKKFVTGVDAPTNLRPLEIGPNSITVTWDGSEADVDSYTLNCRDVRSGITHELRMDATDTQEATFTTLLPLTRYNISLHAEMGQSSSQRVSIAQLTALPAPTNLDVAMPTYDDLLVTWNAVIGLADAGFMGLYNVTISHSDLDDTAMEFLVPGANTRLLVPHLIPGLTYNVTLTAQSNNPRVPRSPQVAMSFMAPVDPPTGVTVSMVGYNNATIYWSRVRAPITEYLVEFRDFDETVEKVSMRVPANHTFATLSDLSDETTYIVNVTAVMPERTSATGTAILTTDIMMIEPPESLHVVWVTWDRIEIEWIPSITESVQAYLVTCTPVTANAKDKNVTVGKDDTSAVMNDLSPGTLYHLNVYALLQHRFSVPAQTSVRTELDPPQDLMFVSVSDRSFTLHWMAPRASVTGYIMAYYRTDVEDERAEVEIPKMSSTYSIHRLEPATEYTVELYSTANGSKSLPTVAVVITLPAPITRLRSVKQGVNTIAVTWSRPESGEITGYEMRYYPVEQPENRRVTELTENKTRHLVKDLLPATFYHIQILSKHHQDLSVARSITQGTTIPAVKSLRVQPVDDSRVTVNWNAPPGVAVEGYRIAHRSLDDLGDYVTKTVPRHAVTSTIAGLTADTQYSVQVTPTITGFIGKPKQVKATTGSYLETPEQLQVSNIRDNSAEVTWESVNDKTISGYLVTYKPLGGSTEDAVEKEVMGRNRKSLVLMSLQPATVYYVTLATLRHGLVSFPPAHQRFLTAQILVPPSNVKVNVRTETTIGLEWATQTADHVEEYHVTYSSERGGRTSEIIQAEQNISRILISDLQSGRRYRISVRSFRWGIDSADETVVNVTTLHVLRRPIGLKITFKNQTAATVTWRSSTPDADGYDVTLTPVGGAKREIELRVNFTEAELCDLKPGTTYRAFITTRRATKQSKSSSVSFTTDKRLDPPSNVTVELIGESGARLHWAAPEQNLDVVKIGYRSDNDKEENVTSVVSGVTSYEFSGLHPNTLYQVWMTSSFQGKDSAVTRKGFTTDYVIPPPVSLRFSEVTETSMTLNWRRTSERARYFRVECQSEDGDRRTIVVSWRKTEVPLRSLQSATTYNVSIFGLGQGKESLPLLGTITTLLGSVQNVSVTEGTSESVVITWRPPAGSVNRYTVVYYEDGDEHNPATLTVLNNTHANITGLFPDTRYVFQVAAHKERLRSISSKKPVQTKLDPPNQVHVTEIGRRSANVAWQPARAKHVTGYHVTVLASKKLYRREYNVTFPTTHIWLRRLLPDTNYVVRVSTQKSNDISTTSVARFKTGTLPFPKPKDCAEVLLNGQKSNGVYDVFLRGVSPLKVRCDMQTDGGGWIVVQRRSDGSESFDRDWDEYIEGFGNPADSEFWLGLENMHLLSLAPQELRIDLRHNAKNAYSTFDHVTISDEESGYVIQGGSYNGNAGDSLSYHFGMKFTTRDVDHDTAYGRNCAKEYQGAWWFRNCHRSSLNGQYNNTRHSQGINWFTWGGFTRSIEFVEMKLRPQNLRRSDDIRKSECRGTACHGRR